MNCNKVLKKVFTESMKYQIFITHKICMHNPSQPNSYGLVDFYTYDHLGLEFVVRLYWENPPTWLMHSPNLDPHHGE